MVVYKVDRLSRSLLDFARLMGSFDQRSVSFVSVTQQFNTTTSLGRLTLNILSSFAQFERELISERTREKMSAARRKGAGSLAAAPQPARVENYYHLRRRERRDHRIAALRTGPSASAATKVPMDEER